MWLPEPTGGGRGRSDCCGADTVRQVLGELLAVTRALARSLAAPDDDRGLELVETRAALVCRLRGLLESGRGARAGLDGAEEELGELQRADRQLRRVVASRAEILDQRILVKLALQRITLRGYLGGRGGGRDLPYC